MAVTFNTIQTYLKNNWKLTNLYGKSKIAVLFPNELQQDGGAFKAEVFLPVMTEASLQTDWNPTTGFNEKYVTEEFVKVQLTQNFTVYNRISKIDKLADNWAENKLNITDSQKAKALDRYVLSKISAGVTKFVANPETIDKTNFVKELKRLQTEVEKQDAHLEDMLIFIDHMAVVGMLEAKIQFTQVPIENTSATIKSALGFSFVEASISTFGYQMIAVHPQAFSWLLAVDVAMQAGQYTQGPYLGQTFIADNEFYEGKIVQDKFVVGYKNKEEVPAIINTENQEQIEQAKSLATALVVEKLPNEYNGNKEITKNLEKLLNAKSIDEIYTCQKVIFDIIDNA